MCHLMTVLIQFDIYCTIKQPFCLAVFLLHLYGVFRARDWSHAAGGEPPTTPPLSSIHVPDRGISSWRTYCSVKLPLYSVKALLFTRPASISHCMAILGASAFFDCTVNDFFIFLCKLRGDFINFSNWKARFLMQADSKQASYHSNMIFGCVIAACFTLI